MNSEASLIAVHSILSYGLLIRAIMTDEKLYILAQAAKQINLVFMRENAGSELSRLSPKNLEAKVTQTSVAPNLGSYSPAKKNSVITNIDNSFLTPITTNELLNGAQSVCDSKGRQ